MKEDAMSEQQVEETPEQAAEPQEQLGDAGKKALEAERRNARTAARERDALAAKLAEIENATKTEAQKIVDRAEQAEKRAVEAESRIMRLEVAAEKGLTAAQAKRLVGATREELEADADELLATFKPATPPGVPSLDLGVKPTANGAPTMNQLIRKAAGRA